MDLPVIVHDREAHGDSLAIALEYPGLRGVFHCFSGSPEMAQALLKRGWYLGFDGPITYKNAQKAPEVAAVTPPYVLEKLAEWKGGGAEDLTRITWENGLRLFSKIRVKE